MKSLRTRTQTRQQRPARRIENQIIVQPKSYTNELINYDVYNVGSIVGRKNKYIDLNTNKNYKDINPYNVVNKITRKNNKSNKLYKIQNKDTSEIFELKKIKKNIILINNYIPHPASLSKLNKKNYKSTEIHHPGSIII